MKAILTRATGVFALLLALCVQAQGQTPDAVVKATTDEVLTAIKQTKDQRALIELAEQKVLPRFDFKRMTQLAVGQSWAKATPAQQEALERAFRTLLVRTYTAALSQSSGNTKVDIKPVAAEGSEATVRTLHAGTLHVLARGVLGTLAAEGKQAVVQRDLDCLEFDARNVQLQHEPIRVLLDVRLGNPVGCCS